MRNRECPLRVVIGWPIRVVAGQLAHRKTLTQLLLQPGDGPSISDKVPTGAEIGH